MFSDKYKTYKRRRETLYFPTNAHKLKNFRLIKLTSEQQVTDSNPVFELSLIPRDPQNSSQYSINPSARCTIHTHIRSKYAAITLTTPVTTHTSVPDNVILAKH